MGDDYEWNIAYTRNRGAPPVARNFSCAAAARNRSAQL
jgi:hypothetical protein